MSGFEPEIIQDVVGVAFHHIAVCVSFHAVTTFVVLVWLTW